MNNRRMRTFKISTNHPLTGHVVEKEVKGYTVAEAVAKFHKLLPTRTVYGVREA